MFVEYNTVVEEQVTVIREYTDSVDNSGNGEYQTPVFRNRISGCTLENTVYGSGSLKC